MHTRFDSNWNNENIRHVSLPNVQEKEYLNYPVFHDRLRQTQDGRLPCAFYNYVVPQNNEVISQCKTPVNRHRVPSSQNIRSLHTPVLYSQNFRPAYNSLHSEQNFQSQFHNSQQVCNTVYPVQCRNFIINSSEVFNSKVKNSASQHNGQNYNKTQRPRIQVKDVVSINSNTMHKSLKDAELLQQKIQHYYTLNSNCSKFQSLKNHFSLADLKKLPQTQEAVQSHSQNQQLYSQYPGILIQQNPQCEFSGQSKSSATNYPQSLSFNSYSVLDSIPKGNNTLVVNVQDSPENAGRPLQGNKRIKIQPKRNLNKLTNLKNSSCSEINKSTSPAHSKDISTATNITHLANTTSEANIISASTQQIHHVRLSDVPIQNSLPRLIPNNENCGDVTIKPHNRQSSVVIFHKNSDGGASSESSSANLSSLSRPLITTVSSTTTTQSIPCNEEYDWIQSSLPSGSLCSEVEKQPSQILPNQDECTSGDLLYLNSTNSVSFRESSKYEETQTAKEFSNDRASHENKKSNTSLGAELYKVVEESPESRIGPVFDKNTKNKAPTFESFSNSLISPKQETVCAEGYEVEIEEERTCKCEIEDQLKIEETVIEDISTLEFEKETARTTVNKNTEPESASNDNLQRVKVPTTEEANVGFKIANDSTDFENYETETSETTLDIKDKLTERKETEAQEIGDETEIQVEFQALQGKYKSKINREKLDMLIKFLKKDDIAVENHKSTLKNDSTLLRKTNEKKKEFGSKYNKKKIMKTCVLKSKNNNKEMISKISPKKSKLLSIPHENSLEKDRKAFETDERMFETNSKMTKSKENHTKESVKKNNRVMERKSRGKYNETITEEERKVLRVGRSLKNLKNYFCLDCYKLTSVELIWLNIISGEVKCLNCVKRLELESDEQNTKDVSSTCVQAKSSYMSKIKSDKEKQSEHEKYRNDSTSKPGGKPNVEKNESKKKEPERAVKEPEITVKEPLTVNSDKKLEKEMNNILNSFSKPKKQNILTDAIFNEKVAAEKQRIEPRESVEKALKTNHPATVLSKDLAEKFDKKSERDSLKSVAEKIVEAESNKNCTPKADSCFSKKQGNNKEDKPNRKDQVLVCVKKYTVSPNHKKKKIHTEKKNVDKFKISEEHWKKDLQRYIANCYTTKKDDKKYLKCLLKPKKKDRKSLESVNVKSDKDSRKHFGEDESLSHNTSEKHEKSSEANRKRRIEANETEVYKVRITEENEKREIHPVKTICEKLKKNEESTEKVNYKKKTSGMKKTEKVLEKESKKERVEIGTPDHIQHFKQTQKSVTEKSKAKESENIMPLESESASLPKKRDKGETKTNHSKKYLKKADFERKATKEGKGLFVKIPKVSETKTKEKRESTQKETNMKLCPGSNIEKVDRDRTEKEEFARKKTGPKQDGNKWEGKRADVDVEEKRPEKDSKDRKSREDSRKKEKSVASSALLAKLMKKTKKLTRSLLEEM